MDNEPINRDRAEVLNKIMFREGIIRLQGHIKRDIASGQLVDSQPDSILKHTFVPRDKKYNCHTYARDIFMPKGTVVIGKIHRHAHLSFILEGVVSVATESGPRRYQAPCYFVSEPGAKRLLVVEEDCRWVTVHLTEHGDKSKLDEIESELIAESYEDLGT